MLLPVFIGSFLVFLLMTLLFIPARWRLAMLGFVLFLALVCFVEGFRFVSGEYPFSFNYGFALLGLGIYLLCCVLIRPSNKRRLKEEEQDDSDVIDKYNIRY